MVTTIKILITVTLFYYLSRAIIQAIAIGAGSAVLTMSGRKFTKEQTAKLDHLTGKAVLGAIGALLADSTLIICLWIWL